MNHLYINSTVVSHKQCPRCAEKGNDNHQDNLGVYSDGHSYCFACGFYVPVPSSIQSLKRQTETRTFISPNLSGDLADYNEYFISCTKILPTIALQWLTKYGISKQEALDHDLYYDKDSELLIFPIKDLSNNLVGFNARNFSGTGPKYISKGNLKEHPQYIWAPLTQTKVFTEDFVSAIKISRQFVACPIFGTKLHTNFLFPEWEESNHILWLDFDKAKESIKQTTRLRQFYPNIFSLITKKDPKEYSDKEINAFVLDCIARST